MRYTNRDHTFVLVAYQENTFLENCGRSILAQSVLGDVMMATSTPNDYLRGLSERYGIPLCVNPNREGIGSDWNYAYSVAKTPLVTLCHQDDWYHPDFLKCSLEAIGPKQTPIIIFTDYDENREGETAQGRKNMRIKRLMEAPLRFRPFQRSILVRRSILAFGDPICCPAVTLNKALVPEEPFHRQYRSCLDWDAWERLSRLRGDFVYCPRRLMTHRIWPGSATSACIDEQSRTREEREILGRFWPHFAASIISRLYATAQKSNAVTVHPGGSA